MSTVEDLPTGAEDRWRDTFARALPIADAILWEGYVLYPYRASAAKNRLRFNWGIVGPAEGRSMSSSMVVDVSNGGHIRAGLRFLHLIRRSDGWDEAVAVRHDVHIPLRSICEEVITSPFAIGASSETRDDGLWCHRDELCGAVTVTGRRGPHDDGSHAVITIAVHNDTPADPSSRDESMSRSLVGCHFLLAADHDVFVSALEPPPDLEPMVAGLEQHRAWPVLIGPAPARDLVFASPVILYDYPAVARESAGDFYDSTEIDEMLALRVHTLTEQEKAEARALDPRARAIIDRHDRLDATTMDGLHGTIRDGGTDIVNQPRDPNPSWSDPGPGTVLVGDRPVSRGSKVRLAPTRRADVHDMFLRGRTATVKEVVNDVDGEVHVAVIVDDDPAADLFEAQRRYLYFAPDELVGIGGDDD